MQAATTYHIRSRHPQSPRRTPSRSLFYTSYRREMNWSSRHNGSAPISEKQDNAPTPIAPQIDPKPIPPTPQPSCTTLHLSTLLYSLLSNTGGHCVTSKNVKFTTLLNLLQTVSDCRSSVTSSRDGNENNTSRTNWDPSRGKVTDVLDCFYRMTIDGFEESDSRNAIYRFAP